MDERTHALLTGFVDGTLSPEDEVRARELVERDAEARRFVDEHRLLWSELEHAFDEVQARADGDFRERTVAAARAEEPPRRLRLITPARMAAAAAVLLAVLLQQLSTSDAPGLSAEDRDVVRYLHVLRSLDTVESRGELLDLRYDLEVLRAFEGEMVDEG